MVQINDMMYGAADWIGAKNLLPRTSFYQGRYNNYECIYHGQDP